MCPKIIERWEAEPWKGFQIPHRKFALSVKQSVHCMVVFIPLTASPPSKSLQVCPGMQGGYHAVHRWDVVIQPLRSLTLLRGTVIHRGASGPGRALFIPFAPVGYRSRMLTVEPESVTELMSSVPVMPGAEEVEEQPQEQRQEQRQEQQEGVEVDVDVEVDWEVPEGPEPADFGDALHSPDKFLKVTSANATAVDVVDWGGDDHQPPVSGAGDSAGFGTE